LISRGSICDPLRALRRIPVITSGKPVLQGLTERVAGYLATDSSTPLVGHYLDALARIYKLDVKDYHVSDHDMDFRIRMGPYPFGEHTKDTELAINIIGRQFAVETDVVMAAIENLGAATTVEDLVSIRCMFPEDSTSDSERFVFVPEGREVGGNKCDHPQVETHLETAKNKKISKDDGTKIVVDNDDGEESISSQKARQRERQRERKRERETKRQRPATVVREVQQQRDGVERPDVVVCQPASNSQATDDAVGQRLPIKGNRVRNRRNRVTANFVRVPDHAIGVLGHSPNPAVQSVGALPLPLV
jgi:hypothetical protein